MTTPHGSSPAHPLFAVAMLRIALELKKNADAPLEALVEQVTERMRLDGPAFRKHLELNLGLLRANARPPSLSPEAAPARAPRRRTQRG